MSHVQAENKVQWNGIDTENNKFHLIDFEDVAISPAAIRIIVEAAKTVMRQHMPGSSPDSLTGSQAIAMFLDHLYWEEKNGGLVMCTDVDSKSFCLPIPKDHWSLAHGERLQ